MGAKTVRGAVIAAWMVVGIQIVGCCGRTVVKEEKTYVPEPVPTSSDRVDVYHHEVP